MLLLLLRDLGLRDLVHHLVHDLVRRLLKDLRHGMDRYLLVHRYRDLQNVVDIVNQNLEHQPDVVKMGALQNLDEQNLDEVLTFQVEEHQSLADVQVGVELRRLLKMDCYLDEVGVGLRHLLNHL